MLALSRYCNYFITLYRGDFPNKETELLSNGIKPKVRYREVGYPNEKWQKLMHYPPEILPSAAKYEFLRHVLKEHATKHRSPFVSFSGRRDVALKYALGEEQQRKKGLLITLNLRVVKEYKWEASPIWGKLLIDSAGRRWFFVPDCKFPGVVPQKTMERFFSLGVRDAEYLLLGNLSPGKFKLEKVQLI